MIPAGRCVRPRCLEQTGYQGVLEVAQGGRGVLIGGKWPERGRKRQGAQLALHPGERAGIAEHVIEPCGEISLRHAVQPFHHADYRSGVVDSLGQLIAAQPGFLAGRAQLVREQGEGGTVRVTSCGHLSQHPHAVGDGRYNADAGGYLPPLVLPTVAPLRARCHHHLRDGMARKTMKMQTALDDLS